PVGRQESAALGARLSRSRRRESSRRPRCLLVAPGRCQGDVGGDRRTPLLRRFQLPRRRCVSVRPRNSRLARERATAHRARALAVHSHAAPQQKSQSVECSGRSGVRGLASIGLRLSLGRGAAAPAAGPVYTGNMRKPRTAVWAGTAFGMALAMTLLILIAKGTGETQIHLALRVTARWSFLLFWLAYAGSA